MTRRRPVSKALRQTRAWKQASYREVANLPPREALREIMRRAHAEAAALGFKTSTPERPALVAEAPVPYRAKRKPGQK